jgi:uncharacterized protein YukE
MRKRDRIAELRKLIKRLQKVQAPLGEKWRRGMIDYYSRVLAELESAKREK